MTSAIALLMRGTGSRLKAHTVFQDDPIWGGVPKYLLANLFTSQKPFIEIFHTASYELQKLTFST
jgi:hypothetical protein